jgi:A/G-specific adenine glycosylase
MSDEASGPTNTQIATFQSQILTWYDSFKRDLPWRGDPDPYHVLVSEVML